MTKLNEILENLEIGEISSQEAEKQLIKLLKRAALKEALQISQMIFMLIATMAFAAIGAYIAYVVIF